MNIWKRIAASIAMLALGILAVLAFLFFLLSANVCENQVFAEQLSPNKTYKAVLFQRDCGATTGFSSQVSLLNADSTLANESGNIMVVDGHPDNNAITLTWSSNDELVISQARFSRQYKAEQTWGSFNKISIRYITASNSN
ncbi:DUF5412 family protein [Litorilituus sediminis]|uniref:Uncharacterized protein n=1 Tax=Litorilituus sediminis TaxID=718192 RepID=A0A4P6P621_9GAMM|nr:DUF5412 family protein [Litorilituus sediminis]QBG37146.1 hypothetical protein EMK97_16120 [Litorilituus sediminis]